jgi:hypothetical protein
VDDGTLVFTKRGVTAPTQGAHLMSDDP